MVSLMLNLFLVVLTIPRTLHVLSKERDDYTTSIASTESLTKQSTDISSQPNTTNTTFSFTSGNCSSSINAGLVTKPTIKKNTDKSAEALLNKVEHVKNIYVVPPVCIIGIIGNMLVASTLFSKRGNNSSFIYMFALLLADTLSLVADLLTPLSYLENMSSTTSSNKIAVNLRHYNEVFISFVLRCTSINILCVLSVERFIAIKFPLHLKISWSARYPKIFIILSIFMAVFSNLLQLIHFEFAEVQIKGSNNTIYKKVQTAFYSSHKEEIDKVVIFMKLFAGPVQILFFSVMNILIVYGIRQNSKAMKMINSTRTNSNEVQVKLCKIFVILSVLNAAAFLPNSIMPIIGRLFPSLGLNIMDPSTKLILQSFKFCRVLNSANDFIIFLAMSKETRQDLKNNCLCTKLKDRNALVASNSKSSNRS